MGPPLLHFNLTVVTRAPATDGGPHQTAEEDGGGPQGGPQAAAAEDEEGAWGAPRTLVDVGEEMMSLQGPGIEEEGALGAHQGGPLGGAPEVVLGTMDEGEAEEVAEGEGIMSNKKNTTEVVIGGVALFLQR
ncbi:hypothetical protein EMWEY_00049830 [Eimeria maxima]|uniref:Uncharacterized protein n=1 Tax=Eimeria maxima TaxID=5804 RepID=U6LW56_EIMMA|nr:hypothetical protein EMWEY_00049830 [Eimeria maxima]CDJ56177.1 hypothetical protein EMWEY_00049830 [Eimeria maxima]